MRPLKSAWWVPLGALLAAAGCGLPDGRMHEPSKARQELRPTDSSSDLLYRYEPTDVVEHYDTPDGGFRVHYTRAGPNAVPTLDTQDSGVPDLVESIGAVYEEVASFYSGQLGFRAPLSDQGIWPNGGNGRFDVYLLDFAGNGDGTARLDDCIDERCIAHVVQENDFAGYGYPSALVGTRTLASHEYFHAIQNAYDAVQDAVFDEATAVWGTEQFDPSMTDLDEFTLGYLSQPDRSLNVPPPGPMSGFVYGASIFFQFLTERFDGALVRKLWERCENGQGDPSVPQDVANPQWLVQLDALLKAEYGSSFPAAFTQFATWNLYTESAADPLVAYQNGASYPKVASVVLTSPASPKSLRVFYASTQYFRVAAGGRTSMTAALIDDPAVLGDDLEGLSLVIAARSGGKNAQVLQVSDPGAGTEAVSIAPADEIYVAVVNTALQGEGGVLAKRPALCIGSVAEVASCKSAFLSGGADAGVTLPAASEQLPVPAGCGCTQAPAGLGLIALCAFMFARSSRRRSASAAV